MTLSGIVFVVSWVPQVVEFFSVSGLNWVAIISGVLTLGFAYWTIIDLYVKLESRPTLLVMGHGASALDSDEQGFPTKFEWFYHVLIVNSSPDKALGIIDIKLRIRYKSETKHLRPYVGIPRAERHHGSPVEGDVSCPVWLRPNASKEGTLAFVEERGEESRLPDAATEKDLPDMNIILMDAQKRKHMFPVPFLEMTQFPKAKIIR